MQDNKNTKRLKIIFLTPRFLFPLIGGDRLKPYYLLSHLAKKHDVTLVSFSHAVMPPDNYLKVIEQLGVELITIPVNPIKSGIRTFLRLHLKYPLEISFYLTYEFKAVVNKLINDRKFDIGFSFFMRTAEYLKNAPFNKVLLAEDCRTLYQYRSYRETNNLKQKLTRWWEYRKLRTYEPDIVDYFDATTLVTNEDIESMRKQNSKANYKLLTNGVDIHNFIPPKEPDSRKGILFAGKLDIWANVLMLQTIVNDILPLIRQELPDVELNIVGSNPPDAVKSLAKGKKYINIFPDVPDIKPYYQNAEVFLHPHTGGSGIQNKLLEAMACGCPVVTTSTGNQGINAKHGEEVFLGNNPEEFAQYTIDILKDKEMANKIGLNARLLIEQTHSWESVFDDLDNIIDELVNC